MSSLLLDVYASKVQIAYWCVFDKDLLETREMEYKVI